MEKQNPTQHSMTRRAAAHDYTRPGIYHITLHVADDLGHPLGAVVGNLSAPDGSADGHLLLITPWQYHYQPEDASISVPTCKAMNCLAQALARQKDTWWQQQ